MTVLEDAGAVQTQAQTQALARHGSALATALVTAPASEACPTMVAYADGGDAMLEQGTRVGDFCILGFIGEGTMGQVYLAQDITLGRRIALKLVKRSVMQGGDAGRFLEEARATAAFSHPHIVTLHAVGEYVGRPYLALEYLDGESLRARISGGPLPVTEALHHGRAIAEAIAEAHRHGIVHADLKPDNVVLPRDGRLRVVDFGLARLAGRSEPRRAATVSGTPAYMAPERSRGAPPTGAIDVWALGVMLHELITGHRPLSADLVAQLGSSRDRLPLASLPEAPWARIVRDCLALAPEARPTAAELVRRLTALLAPHDPYAPHAPRASRFAADPRCPFPGPAAFSRSDAAGYFGRRAKRDALAAQLRTRALVPVIGPPRAGKSSFLRAALQPHLEAAGGWITIAISPGAQPFDSLAAALALHGPPDRPAAALAEAIRQAPDGLARALGDVARHHGTRVLLILDPLEEVFAAPTSKADARAFCDCLGRAADATAPWRIVLGLRDDLLDRLAAVPSLRRHLGGVMRLGPLSTADLRAAVVEPLAAAGYEADAPALVEQLLRDVEGQPGCLPVLQLACRSLWEHRDPATRRILLSEYEVMGGAAGALAGQARRFLAELSPGEVRLVRALLLGLFHEAGPHRPRRRDELLERVPAGARDLAGRLLDRLIERDLLVEARPATEAEVMIQLAHGALDAAWPRLARWIDETHDVRVALARLEDAALAWHHRGRRDADTASGAALADLAHKLDQADQEQLAVSPLARAFLAASRRRELRGHRRWRWLTDGFAAIVAMAIALFSLAFTRKEPALRELQMGRCSGDRAARHRERPASAGGDLTLATSGAPARAGHAPVAGAARLRQSRR